MDAAGLLVRRRGAVVLCWAAALGLLGTYARGVEKRLEAATRVDGSQSAQVERELVGRFGTPYAHPAFLVIRGAPPPPTQEGQALLDTIGATLAGLPGVTAVRGYRNATDTLLLGGQIGSSFVLVGLDAARERPEMIVPRLRATTAALVSRFAGQYPALTLRWTGEAVLNADLRRASVHGARSAERRVVPITLVVLFAALTTAAAIAPAVSGVLVITLALGAIGIIAGQYPLSILTLSVASMVGLGLGIDYALLTVSRFRDALESSGSSVEAATQTARSAGRTIWLSGIAVAVGFAPMLVIPLAELRSVALGGLVATGFAILVAVTLLPGLLAGVGDRIEWGRLWRARAASGDRWRRWGRRVTARPVAALILAGVPLVFLASQAARLRTGLPPGHDWLPGHLESVTALDELDEMGRGTALHTVRVLLTLPDGTDALSPEGWRAVRGVHARLTGDPRVGAVFSFTTFERDRPMSRLVFAGLPLAHRRTYVTDDRRSVLFDVVPHERAGPPGAMLLVRDLRTVEPATITGISAARIAVGGLPALRVDYDDAIRRDFPLVVGLVLGGTLIALFVGFRSVLVAVKAVALNVVTVAAGFGAVVLVFQDGHGAALVGTAPVAAVFTIVPVLVFCTVFGLSMDYEVFLVARVAEARRAGLDEREAIIEGLTRTGPVITSAAAVMVVVFAGFALQDLLVLKILGFSLATSVAIDASIVRLVVGPALLTLAGRWNWWPGPVGRTP